MINGVDEKEYPYIATLLTFLRYKGAKLRYLRNYEDRHGSTLDSPTVERILRDEGCFTATSASFHWEPSPEGHDFWHKLNDKYEALVIELKKQDILGE